MNESDKGVAFIRLHEGLVTRAYRDPKGVVTIGEGFTMRSRVFAAHWRQTRGHDLRLGDTISKEECDTLVRKLLDAEYTPSIATKAKPTAQHQFDACGSVSYNCGPGSLDAAWAKKLAKGDGKGAAALLRKYKLTGGILKRRRADEARLLETGDYGPIDLSAHGTASAQSVSQTADEVKAYQQQLATLGFYKGALDGIAGQKTKVAVLSYQASHPDLVADGIVGPATRASLARDAAAKTATPKSIAAGIGTAVVAVATTSETGASHPWLSALAIGVAVAVLIGGYLAIRYRAELARRAKPAAPPTEGRSA
ncbi:MAG TPA: peptidoglycan-binding protein [Bauldia sp.]|nr:peptidoglycan-binding protein [Bauldia sp.]